MPTRRRLPNGPKRILSFRSRDSDRVRRARAARRKEIGPAVGAANHRRILEAGCEVREALPIRIRPISAAPWQRERHDNIKSFPVDRTMIIRTARGPEVYLLFSRKNEIAPATKEIIIDFSIGPTKVQAKVKDLEYRSKLEL